MVRCLDALRVRTTRWNNLWISKLVDALTLGPSSKHVGQGTSVDFVPVAVEHVFHELMLRINPDGGIELEYPLMVVLSGRVRI